MVSLNHVNFFNENSENNNDFGFLIYIDFFFVLKFHTKKNENFFAESPTRHSHDKHIQFLTKAQNQINQYNLFFIQFKRLFNTYPYIRTHTQNASFIDQAFYAVSGQTMINNNK